MFHGFDSAAQVTSSVAKNAINAGLAFSVRYYGTGHKLLTLDEAAVICGAGLRIVSVFERTADRAAEGAAAGLADAALALIQAEAMHQPHDTALFFAVDFDTTPAKVVEYFKAIAAHSIASLYRVGIYGNGAVCKAMLDAGHAKFSWVWAGSKTYGTADYVASGKWQMHQYPTVNGGALGISYDPDDANTLDNIAWTLPGTTPVKVAPTSVTWLMVQQRLTELGYRVALDGDPGQETRHAIMAALDAHQ